MIDLQKEKQYKISTQDVYDIVSYAIDSADDGGFLNTFILERALYEYTVLSVYPDDRDRYQKEVAESPNVAWDNMLKDGAIDKLHEDFSDDLVHIADVASQWTDDYERYAHSIRGAMDVVQETMNTVSKYAMNNLRQAANDKALNEVVDIADKWGMNNNPVREENPVKLVDDDKKDKSLFTDDK